MIGSTKLLEDVERAEILLALLNVHERRNDEQGCLRAIAGIHSVFPIEKLVRLLPPGQGTAVARVGVQRALRESEPDFSKRFHAGIER